MKVLFAVSNENISEVIIKKYQQEYKEIITGKNVYYFNAILKELQKDKSYDRIIISEDLEPFANNNFETMDKFIFDKLDNISDEASNSTGEDIPIILICTDRRNKSDSILVKLFGIGVYNALMGTDRSIEQVCALINRPRTKKEAKLYYKIDSEDVNYETEDEDAVSEEEIQSILRHYKNLGKNEDKYAESFNIIAAQYTDKQLILIIKCLPINVRSVLETTCPKYQQLTTFMPKVQTKTPAVAENNKKSKTKKKVSTKVKETHVAKKPPTKTTVLSVSQKGELNNKIDILEKGKKTVPRGNIIVPGVVKTQIQSQTKPIPKVTKLNTKPIPKTINNTKQDLTKNVENKLETDHLDDDMFVDYKEDVQNNEVEVEDKMRNNNINPNRKSQGMNETRYDQNMNSRNLRQQPQQNTRVPETRRVAPNPNAQMRQSRNNLENTNMNRRQMIENDVEQERRGRGRPRKIATEDEMTVNSGMQQEKRGRGRPRKVAIEDEMTANSEMQQEKRGRGRPRKIATEDEVTANTGIQQEKRGRGRPRKIATEDEMIANSEMQQERRGRGRPRKIATEDEMTANSGIQQEKKGRGRPKKIQNEYDDYEDDNVLPGMQDEYDDYEDDVLPGIQDEYDDYEEDNVLPGMQDEYDDYEEDNVLPGMQDEYDDYEEDDVLPGMQDEYDDYEEDDVLPGMQDEYDDYEEDDVLTGMQDEYDDYEEDDVLPGMQNEYDDYEEDDVLPGMQDEYDDYEEDDVLPGMQDEYDDYEDDDMEIPQTSNYRTNNNNYNRQNQRENNYSRQATNNMNTRQNNNYSNNARKRSNSHYIYETEDNYQNSYGNRNMLTNLLTSDKKIAAFVGTTKNGTSFLVNNLAEMLSGQGVRTAILDLTTNRNSYYIFTQNDEDLRKIAYSSINKLSEGIAEGIQVNRNLSVYTCLPDDENNMDDVQNILSTLVQNYSLVLLDCDFNTNYEYFAATQELYLVQSMDVLTIQPLTAFLRDLKARNVLDEEKLRVVINKDVKVKSLTEKTIIGGMAYYNDPAMSFMTELFNKDTIRSSYITFDEQTYSKYLEGIVNCKISLNGYSKEFLLSLKNLASMVYPMVNNRSTYDNSKRGRNYNSGNFSNNMNNTINRMKNNY